jgi:hypothetical protein
MPDQILEIIDAAIADAEAALPEGTEEEVIAWIKTNRAQAFPAEVHNALFEAGLLDRIITRQAFRTLAEDAEERDRAAFVRRWSSSRLSLV